MDEIYSRGQDLSRERRRHPQRKNAFQKFASSRAAEGLRSLGRKLSRNKGKVITVVALVLVATKLHPDYSLQNAVDQASIAAYKTQHLYKQFSRVPVANEILSTDSLRQEAVKKALADKGINLDLDKCLQLASGSIRALSRGEGLEINPEVIYLDTVHALPENEIAQAIITIELHDVLYDAALNNGHNFSSEAELVSSLSDDFEERTVSLVNHTSQRLLSSEIKFTDKAPTKGLDFILNLNPSLAKKI